MHLDRTHYLPFAVAMLAVIFSLISNLSIDSCRERSGLRCSLNSLNHRVTWTPFPAAPLSSSVTFPENKQFRQRNGPPQYSSCESWKTQPLQLMPSKRHGAGPKVTPPFTRTDSGRAGTIGRASFPIDDWAKAVSIFPGSRDDARNIDTAPTANDPSAKASLLIYPPPMLAGITQCTTASGKMPYKA